MASKEPGANHFGNWHQEHKADPQQDKIDQQVRRLVRKHLIELTNNGLRALQPVCEAAFDLYSSTVQKERIFWTEPGNTSLLNQIAILVLSGKETELKPLGRSINTKLDNKEIKPHLDYESAFSGEAFSTLQTKLTEQEFQMIGNKMAHIPIGCRTNNAYRR